MYVCVQFTVTEVCITGEVSAIVSRDLVCIFFMISSAQPIGEENEGRKEKAYKKEPKLKLYVETFSSDLQTFVCSLSSYPIVVQRRK